MAKKTKKSKRGSRLDHGHEVCGTAKREQVEHVSKSPCSIELSRDAKGQARWTIKLYGEADEMDEVLGEVVRLDRDLKDRLRG